MPLNLTQRLKYETDSLDSFEKVLTTLVDVIFKEEPSQYTQMVLTQHSDSFDNGQRWIEKNDMNPINLRLLSKQKYFHICSINDYKPELKKGDELFNSHAQLIQKVMEHLNTAKVKKFFDLCGSGFDHAFNEYDGSIEAGYRLNHRSQNGWNNLDISLCHIYYSK